MRLTTAVLLFLVLLVLSGAASAHGSDTHPTRQAAYEHCSSSAGGDVEDWFSQVQVDPSNFNNTITDGGHCDRVPNSNKYIEKGSMRYCQSANPTVCGDKAYEASYTDTHSWSQECPEGTVWNDDLKVCAAPCQNLAPLTGGWAVTGISVCSGGCEYQPGPGSIFSFQKIDGISYWGTTGWAANGSTCSIPTTANPPPDRDGDGTSDGKDGAPDNPGSDGGKDPAPTPDPGTCGGPSQPKCPDTTNPNDHQSSGGGDCSSPPNSSGDPILAQIAYQTWAGRCGMTGNGNAGPGGGKATDMGPTNTLIENTNGLLSTGNGILGQISDKLSGPLKTTSGTATGGGSCNAPPVCSEGQEIQCHVMNEVWLTRCDYPAELGSAQADAQTMIGLLEQDWDADTQSYGDAYSDWVATSVKMAAGAEQVIENSDGQGDASALDSSGFLSGRTCPDPVITTVHGTQIRIPFSNFCNILSWLGYLILGGAYYKAARILTS